MIRVALPHHLRHLAGTAAEVRLPLSGTVTWADVVDEMESRYPPLVGTMRDPASRCRRPFVRFFAGEQDLSALAPDEPLPEQVTSGRAAFHVVGAMAGG